VLRKERVLETLQLLCARQPEQRGMSRRYVGFSAEEVAVWAEVDRTNASRDLNLLAQEGKIERFPGRGGPPGGTSRNRNPGRRG
jgi:hypothetical protein